MDPVTIAAIIAGVTTLTRILVTSAKVRRDLRDLEREREVLIERARAAEEVAIAQTRRAAEAEARLNISEWRASVPADPDPGDEDETIELPVSAGADRVR